MKRKVIVMFVAVAIIALYLFLISEQLLANAVSALNPTLNALKAVPARWRGGRVLTGYGRKRAAYP